MAAHVDVIIVEDDIWLSEQFERTLMTAGFSVRRAFEGHTAMDLIDELKPKVILLDMLLTESTAVALMHELQSYKDTADIPIIVCTNLASIISIADMSAYGVRRILDKTMMHPDDVTTAVRSVLP